MLLWSILNGGRITHRKPSFHRRGNKSSTQTAPHWCKLASGRGRYKSGGAFLPPRPAFQSPESFLPRCPFHPEKLCFRDAPRANLNPFTCMTAPSAPPPLPPPPLHSFSWTVCELTRTRTQPDEQHKWHPLRRSKVAAAQAAAAAMAVAIMPEATTWAHPSTLLPIHLSHAQHYLN